MCALESDKSSSESENGKRIFTLYIKYSISRLYLCIRDYQHQPENGSQLLWLPTTVEITATQSLKISKDKLATFFEHTIEDLNQVIIYSQEG